MKYICRICAISGFIMFLLVMIIKAEISSDSATQTVELPNETLIGESKVRKLDLQPEPNKNFSDLVSENIILRNKINTLENRLEAIEGKFLSLSLDMRFHHPTTEFQYVDMQVVQWEEALKSDLRNVAIQFQAGYYIGAVSSWEFSLNNENGAITANLRLIEERYSKGALFAGFTAYVLTPAGNVYSQANALPVNFLDGSGRTLHLPNVISLVDIRNSTSRLSDSDVFKMRFRLELLGVGHKLYLETLLPADSPSKDFQKVVFDVEGLLDKIYQQKKQVNNDSRTVNNTSPLTYTRFILKHDSWHIETHWTAELHSEDEGEAVSLHVILEKCEWPELHASFNVEVWDTDKNNLIIAQGTPINNFMKDRITIDPIIIISQLTDTNVEGTKPELQFKLLFVLYGKHARYYTDVV